MNTQINIVRNNIKKKIYDIHEQIFHSGYNKISMSYYELNNELTWAFDPMYGISDIDLYIYNKLFKRIPAKQLKEYIVDINELLVVYHYMTTEDNNTIDITLTDGLSDINSGNYKSILIKASFLDISEVINMARDAVLDYVYDLQKAGKYIEKV